MTVRINKSAFNIREKLKELTQSIGLKGSDLMRAATVQEARDVIGAGRKNMIINGACNINQRNGTNSYTVPDSTGGSYGGPDRWAINEASDGSVSVNMDGDPRSANGNGTAVQEFSKAMQIACSGTDTSLASNQNVHFFQNIEGYNTARLGFGTIGAKDVTLSFWVRSNVPGTYCVGIENNGVDRTCIREYTIKPGNKWQKIVLTFPGCRDGTWETTTAVGMRVRFVLASGTQYDDGIDGQWVNTDELTTGNQTNFMTSTDNRFFITGVQLEAGKVATDFEHRSYGEELALCQRYYYKFRLANQEMIYNEGNGDNNKWHQFYIGHSMRPINDIDVTDVSTGGSIGGLNGTITNYAPQTPGDTPSRVSSRVTMSTSGGTARYMYHYDGWSADYIAVNSEL